MVNQDDLPPGVLDQFDTLLNLAVDPVAVLSVTVPQGTPDAQVAGYWTPLLLLSHANNLNVGTGFVFDPTTLNLSIAGQLSQQLLNVFSQPTITVVRFGANGVPETDGSGHFITDTYTWVAPAPLAALIAATANTSTAAVNGLRLGGPGEFDVFANSINLGNSIGILSCGALDYAQGGLGRFANLATLTPVGADLNVETTGNIELLTSTIASLGGGNVSIRSLDGEIDLGSADVLFSTRGLYGRFCHRLWPGQAGDISARAFGNINVDGSRIAAYDGGDVTVTSDTGNVDAGAGGATAATVETHFVDPATKKAKSYTAGVYGSGILAVTLVDPTQVPNSPTSPGNILVTTPEGDIDASLGGILQEALNGSIAAGPTITLKAGTLPADGTPHAGNINLGDSGVIGGTVNLSANGNITGLIISQQSSTVNATQDIGIHSAFRRKRQCVFQFGNRERHHRWRHRRDTVSGGLGVSADVLPA